MRKIILFIQQHHQGIYNLFLFLISISVVLYLIPRQMKFKYEFQKGKPWTHEDLLAPFDFPVYKTDAEMEQEKNNLIEQQNWFFKPIPKARESVFENFENEIIRYAANANQKAKQTLKFREVGLNVLNQIYQTEVISWPEDLKENEDRTSFLTKEGVSQPIVPGRFIPINQCKKFVEDPALYPDSTLIDVLSPLILRSIEPTVAFDQERTAQTLESQLQGVIETKGFVEKGEIVVFKGNLIDEDVYRKLESLRVAYEGDITHRANIYLVLLGQFILIASVFLVIYLFFRRYRPHVLENSSNLTLILLNVIVMIGVAAVATRFNEDFIYLTPLPILPIVLRSFFDTRLGLFIHYITALIIGFFAPNGFIFVFLQFIAGLYSIATVTGLNKRAQLFTAAARITGVYVVVYFGFILIQEGQLKIEHANILGYFVLNGVLSLFAFPLIYVYEKLFGLVSDVTLLELSDTNNPLLRKLAQRAPGTFQHSLQVADLAENAALEVGGNALLVRTAALYHDIGKTKNPLYFIENQATGVNPHDELSFKESAQIIIGHVLEGIKLSRDAKLPEKIIDFIRTHHGTSTVQYFYKMHIKNFPESEGELEPFKYPGPKPFSKETAILMMCDAVEAASRSLKNPNTEALNQLVDNIVSHQINDHQFDNANITFKDITVIKNVLKTKLRSIYHLRVEYPD